MRIIDPIVGINTEPAEPPMHIEPTVASPVAVIETAIIVFITALIIAGVLNLLGIV